MLGVSNTRSGYIIQKFLENHDNALRKIVKFNNHRKLAACNDKLSNPAACKECKNISSIRCLLEWPHIFQSLCAWRISWATLFYQINFNTKFNTFGIRFINCCKQRLPFSSRFICMGTFFHYSITSCLLTVFLFSLALNKKFWKINKIEKFESYKFWIPENFFS